MQHRLSSFLSLKCTPPKPDRCSWDPSDLSRGGCALEVSSKSDLKARGQRRFEEISLVADTRFKFALKSQTGILFITLIFI